jgi:hypothetical protein
MKRIVFAVGAIVLVFAVSIWAQTTAPKPGPEINKFGIFSGHWTYAIEYKAGPLGPASKATGELTIKKILGGFFYQNQATEKGPAGVSQVMEIVGYEPVIKTLFSNEFHSDGTMFNGMYTSNGNVWTYTGKATVEGKPIAVKNVLTLAADMMTVMAKGEISTDGKTWIPWLEAKYTKTTAAPKM